VISFIALFQSIGIRFFFGSTSHEGSWQPVFFAFLPMCFIFVGMAAAKMHLELRELQAAGY
jgi:hypothetical protein